MTSILLAAMAASLPAQCTANWAPGFEVPGADDTVFAARLWDPDGPGPELERVVIGGQFQAVGSVRAVGIAMRDPTTGGWQPIGAGLQGVVSALAVLPNGDLVAGGDFLLSGASVVSRVARWDGTAWRPLGSGLSGPCFALLAMPDGSVVVGGKFTHAGGVVCNGVARWDGAAWTSFLLGYAGSANGEIRSLARLPNGQLVAAGVMPVASGVTVGNVAVWNGVYWEPLPSSGVAPGLGAPVNAMHVASDGSLYVVGDFVGTAGSPSTQLGRVARWNGSWQALGPGINAATFGITETASGDILVVGRFSSSGSTTAQGIARWNGSAWSPVGTGIDHQQRTPHCVVVQGNGDILVGGAFRAKGLAQGSRLTEFRGTTWQAIGPGLDEGANRLCVDSNDDLWVSGPFTRIGDIAANGLARWDGVTWHDESQGLPSVVDTVVVAADGTVTGITNEFPNNNVLQRSGGVWQTLASSSRAYALLVRRNGTLVVARENRVTEQVPGGWTQLGGSAGSSVMNGAVLSLAETADGDLLAGGTFSSVLGQSMNSVARWNGSQWLPMGTGLPGPVRALTVLADGSVVAGGSFFSTTGPSFVARWDGTTWSAMAAGLNGSVASLASLPNGDLVAGGSFTASGTLALARIARWNGSQWLPLPGVGNGSVTTLALLPDGDLYAGGTFTVSGSRALGRIGRIEPSCRALAASYGNGCTGSAGPLDLVAENLPWLGTTFRSVARGFPANSMGYGLLNFLPTSMQLWLAITPGQPGCELLVDPMSVVIYPMVPNLGTAVTLLPIPRNVSLVGVVVFQQVIAAELQGGSAVVNLTSTNGLAMQLGAF